MNNTENNFKVYSGIRSFSRLEGGFISITDVETNFTIVEEYQRVRDMLKILLTEERMMYFERMYIAGETVVYNFLTNKLSFVRNKEDKMLNDALGKEMNLSVIEERLNDEDSKDTYFLK